MNHVKINIKNLPKYDYSNDEEHDDKNDRAYNDNRYAVEGVLKIRLGIVQDYCVITSI